MAKRLMGLDYGRRRIGVAFCDELGITCTPHGFVPRTDDAAAAAVVARLAEQEGAAGIVVGMPYHTTGRAGENVRWVEDFIRCLEAVCDLEICRIDETYTSEEAEAILRRERDSVPPPGEVDAKAAALILRRHLDGEV